MQRSKEVENVGADQCVRPLQGAGKRVGPIRHKSLDGSVLWRTHGSAPASLIKSLAHETGFDVVGITSLDSLQAGERAIEQWVSEGRHGTMKYLEDFRARRERLLSEIPDAKSVICLGVNYFTTPPRHCEGAERPKQSQNGDCFVGLRPPRNDEVAKGRIARYAWGRDYHTVIREKHEVLIQRLREIVGADPCVRPRDGNIDVKGNGPTRGSAPTFKSCVDTQAIPERFAAQQAGLGFIGKHTGILNQEFGPWLFLSEIVTNLDLEPDVLTVPGTLRDGDSPLREGIKGCVTHPVRFASTPLREGNTSRQAGSGVPLQENGCGTCRNCQDVCPTGALDEDYRIDARLCIAYLTIEHKGVIPRELRPKMKDWIFGCDECLAVCPFTSKQKQTTWPEFDVGADPCVRPNDDNSNGPTRGSAPTINIEELFSIPSQKAYERKFQGTALRRASLKQMLRNACVVLGNWGREHTPRPFQGHPSSAKQRWTLAPHIVRDYGFSSYPEEYSRPDPSISGAPLGALASAKPGLRYGAAGDPSSGGQEGTAHSPLPEGYPRSGEGVLPFFNPLRLLTKALHHPSSLVRLHAAWALGQFSDPEAARILNERLSIETDTEVRNEILQTSPSPQPSPKGRGKSLEKFSSPQWGEGRVRGLRKEILQ